MPNKRSDTPLQPPQAHKLPATAHNHSTGMQSMYLVVMVYAFVPLLIPLGFAFALGALFYRLKSLRAASDACAKNFWRWNVFAHFLFAYAVLVLTLLAVDTLLDAGWALPAWWPTLASHWSGSGNAQVLVLLDVMTALIAALAALGVARYFGYVDEGNMWRPPRRLVAQRAQRRIGNST